MKLFAVIAHSFWSDEIGEGGTDRQTVYESAVAEAATAKEVVKKLRRWCWKRIKACNLKGCRHTTFVASQVTAVMERQGMVREDNLTRLE